MIRNRLAIFLGGALAAGSLLPGTALWAAPPLARPPADPPAGPILVDGEPGPAASPMRTESDMAPKEAPARPATPALRIVRSLQFSLKFQVENVGPSGVSAVELWYTTDGKRWQRYDSPPLRESPFPVSVKEEGVYGFSLVAHNGHGLGHRPPQAGDLPQVLVLVDQTKPVVEIHDAHVAAMSNVPCLTIGWKATDRNLGPRPINLSYAASAKGPWLPIASGVENSGTYVWQLPGKMPDHFFVRVEAADVAGNVGEARTDKTVLFDQSEPATVITGVELSSP